MPAQSGNSNHADDSHLGNPGGNHGTGELGEATPERKNYESEDNTIRKNSIIYSLQHWREVRNVG